MLLASSEPSSCALRGRLYALLRSSLGVSKCCWGLNPLALSGSRYTVCLFC